MGWTFYTDPRRVDGYAGEKDEITALTTYCSSELDLRPLKLSKVGSVWYAAVQRTSLTNGPNVSNTYALNEDGSYVFAAVFLTKYDQGCFGYKDMDETMGPREAKAPVSLLNMLSDLVDPDSYAHGWRQKCRAWAAIPTFAIGDVIDLAAPIALNDGSTLRRVRKSSYFWRGKNRSVYIDTETGASYRLSKGHFVGAKLVAASRPAGTSVLDEFAKRQASQSA